MNKTIAIGLVLLMLAPLAAAGPATFSDAEVAAVETFLRENFDGGNTGMVIGLLDRNGGRVLSAGKLDNDSDAEVDGDTIFELGSVTKVFTSMLALEIARRGEVNIDAPVATLLPVRVHVPTFDDQEITLRHLAAQDSGLPWHPHDLQRIFGDEIGPSRLEKLREAADAYTTEDLYGFLSGFMLPDAPGSNFQYSNVGMALLGHALELRAGEPFETLVGNRICQPLKMDSTRIVLTAEQRMRLARGHWADGRPSESINFQVMAPAGSLLSTGNDLLKFLSATLSFTESNLRPVIAEMQKVRHTDVPRFGTTATPWHDNHVYQPPGSELLGHGGGGFGYLAFIGFDMVKRRGVVVLSNQLAVNSSGVGWAILQSMPLSQRNVAGFVREVVGLGVALALDEESGDLRVTYVFPKSSAGEVGLAAGVVIQTINDVSVNGKSMQECLKLMSGVEGSQVRLEVLEPDQKDVKAVVVTRRKFLTSS